MLVPGGFGTRGLEGKMTAVQYAREKKVPFLGICLGMQMAVIEFARHVLGLRGRQLHRVGPRHHLPGHRPDAGPGESLENLGGTMRLGKLSLLAAARAAFSRKAYGVSEIEERHRHRYEFNNDYREQLCRPAACALAGIYPERQPGGDCRAARPSLVRGRTVPPGAQEPPQPAPSPLPRLCGRRPGTW